MKELIVMLNNKDLKLSQIKDSINNSNISLKNNKETQKIKKMNHILVTLNHLPYLAKNVAVLSIFHSS